MIGETLHSARRFPWGAIIWFAVAVGCVAISISTHRYHMAVVAILPASLGLILFLRRSPEFHADIAQSEIIVHSSNETIRFMDIEKIWCPGDHLLNGPLIVFHRGGTLQIPANSCRSTQSLGSFLESVKPPTARVVVHGAIANYLDSQIATFGEERVWAYAAAERIRQTNGGLARSIYIALAITAFAWIVTGIVTKDGGWFGATAMLALIALITLLIRISSHGIDSRIKNWRESSIVITPLGLALVQGELKGELRWRELVDVQYRGSASAARRMIQLKVEGARIDIRDIYDAPLSEIYDRITTFWRAQ